MSIFAAAKNISQQRAVTLPGTTVAEPLEWFRQFMGGTDSSSGIQVDADKMITLSAVFNAIQILSETVAQQPLSPYLEYEENNLTKKRKYKEHPSYRLIAHEAMPGYMTAYTWRKLMMNYAARWQNAYSVIERDGNMGLKSLIPVHPKRVVPKLNNRKELVYQIDNGDMEISALNMIHIVGFTDDGIAGRALPSIAGESLGYALAVERFGGMYFGKGIHQSGFIKHPGKLKDPDAVERLKSSFLQKYGGWNGKFGVGVLEEGAEYEPMDIEPEKAQLFNTRKLNIEEVARWLNVPVTLLKQLDKASYNNSEQTDIQFTKYTIAPWNVSIEQELWRKLLTEREKEESKIYFKHNMNGLLRGDTATRSRFYQTMSATGAFSPNMILEREDENPYEGGDVHVINPGAQTIEKLQSEEENNGNDI